MLRVVCVLWFVSACLKSNVIECDDGRSCPSGSICDDVHRLCVHQSQLDACAGAADGATCTMSATDDGVCDANVCLTARCNDGYLRTGEVCDGTMFSGISNCKDLGFYDDVPLKCDETCSLDDSPCTGTCGDGILALDHELCDGAPPNATCVDFGFGTGFLNCSENCGPGTAECISFGWDAAVLPQPAIDLHASSETDIWIVGFAGMVQHFDGVAWTAVDTSACGTSNITAVWAVGGGAAFAVEDDNLLRLTTAGCTKDTIASVYFTDVWASGPSDAYAVSQSGAWHFDGSSWTKVHSTSSSVVWGSGPNDVYTASDSSNAIRHFTGSWSAATPVSVDSLVGIDSIWGTSSTDVYLGGHTNVVQAVVAHGSGTTWTSMTAGLSALSDGRIRGGWSAGGITVGIADYSSGGTNAYAYVRYDGTDWASLGAPLTGPPAMWISQAGTIYGTDFYRRLQFAGTALVDLKIPPAAITSIAAISQREIYVVGVTQTVMRWDGSKWTALESSGNAAQDVTVAGGNVYTTGQAGLRKRTGPQTWQTLDASLMENAVRGTGDTDLWLINGGGLKHFTGTASPPLIPFPNIVNDVLALTPTVAFAVGYNGMIEIWNGSTWSVSPSGTTEVLNKVWGTSQNDVYVGGRNRVLLHYNGSVWTPLPSPPTGVTALWATSMSDIFVAGEAGLVHYDGQHWVPVDYGSAFGIAALTPAGDTLLIGAVGDMRQLIRVLAW